MINHLFFFKLCGCSYMRILDSRPKLLFACVFHLSLALGAGFLIPETDIVAAALQAQATDLASV